jgi:SAM-dependent MidA family methyltransferase
MGDALYGERGFYRSTGAPARHFRTASHSSQLWAAAITTLASRVDAELGEPDSFTIVDVGAGGGELLDEIAAIAPGRWDLVGVDVAARPAHLAARVSWATEVPSDIEGLLIANELLDVVPVDVVERIDGMPRQVEVTPTGEEEVAGLATGRDAEWLSTWWPLAEDGDRAEIGWPRDELWRSLAATMRRGLAVVIDYAADPGRDQAGTMTGFRDGRQVLPVPDGSCDITAHVMFESLAEPGDLLLSQRDALVSLGVTADHPAYEDDAASYLTALSSAGEAAELLDAGGLGGFTWLLHGVGLDPTKITAS